MIDDEWMTNRGRRPGMLAVLFALMLVGWRGTAFIITTTIIGLHRCLRHSPCLPAGVRLPVWQGRRSGIHGTSDGKGSDPYGLDDDGDGRGCETSP
jgi:hypothetical protein